MVAKGWGPEGWGPEGRGPNGFGGRRLHTTTPENSERAHFRAWRFKHHQNSTKRHPRERRKKENCGGRGKKARNFGLPTPRDSPFSGCIAHQFGKDCPTQPYFPPFCIFGSFGESYLLLQVLGEDTALAWSGEAPKESIEQSLC